VAFALAWFLAMLNVSAMPYIKVLGVTPDLVLIFAASWVIVRGQDEGLVVVPMAGLLHDLVGSDPVGTSVLAMAPIVLLAAAVRLQAMDTDFVPALGVVAAGSLLYGIIAMIVLAVTGEGAPFFYSMLRVIIPAAIVNALFTPIIYLPVHWLSPRKVERFQARRLASQL
jgi:rod shape-determining protein MreD